MDAGGATLADDSLEIRQNSAEQSLDLLGNDFFAADYSGARRITAVSYGSEGGRIAIEDDGRSVSYAPPADFSGTETFAYYVDNQWSANATVTVLPLLAPDQYEFPPDGEARNLRVLDNDPFWADYDGARKITLTSATSLGGALEIAADGQSLIYTPPLDAFGKDYFVYIVDDLYPAEVRIDVPNPLEPDRYPDIVQNSEDNLFRVLTNDVFWTGYTGDRVITHVIQPARGGTVTIADDGKTLSFTPATDYSGSDSFRYVVDGLYEANVTLTVHRPVRDDRFELDTNTVDYPLPVTENDQYSFYDGSRRVTRDVVERVTWVGDTAHGGTVEITADGQRVIYSAPPGFEGRDTFDYIADGKHLATVVVDVMRPVRDDSIYQGVYEDTTERRLDVLENDFKGNGYRGPKIITSVSETSEGGTLTIAAAGRWLVYTPPSGFRGIDTFSYTVDDEYEADVRVQVRSIFSVHSHRYLDPYPLQDEYVLHVLPHNPSSKGYQGSGLITAVNEVTNGGHATISDDGQSIRFVPGDGGQHLISYTVDDKYEAWAEVDIRNYLRSDSFTVDQGSQATEFEVLANDFRAKYSAGYGGPREITSVGPSSHGATVTIAADGKTVYYTPAPDFFGADRFTYTVDQVMRREVRVQVIRRVRDDEFRVETDSQENALTVLVNDLFGADYSGAGRVTAVTETTAGGTVAVGPDGQSVLYTPPAYHVGRDTFRYTVDGALKAEVTVWVGTTVDDLLTRFGSFEEIGQFLLGQALERYDHLFGQPGSHVVPVYEMYAGFDSSTDVSVNGRTHSETNVQVAGVDEGDIIETDGDYLYVLSGSELIIAKAWPADELSVASRLAIESAPLVEYLDGDRLTVVSRIWETPDTPLPSPRDVATNVLVDSVSPGFGNRYWPTPRNTKVCVTVFDVSDREAPGIVEKTTFDGTYVESRRIDGSVFLVLRNDRRRLDLPHPELVPVEGDEAGSNTTGLVVLGGGYVYETREQYVERMTGMLEDHVASQLPSYASYDAEGELVSEGSLHGPEDLVLPTASDARSLISVVSLNMNDDAPGVTASTGVLATNAVKIYGSLENLYLFDEHTTDEDRVTRILAFAWEAESGSVELAARGQVAGHMLNQFSADEHEGYLRIATTIRNSGSGNWSGRSENVLFVLRDDGGVLEFVGGMQNLALDERIRSVRYMGDRAFMTTFRTIDPLFAVDLSDPARPQSRGYVTMPGFNSYMQLIDENHLLTVGRNTPRFGGGPTQVSLFDIEDLNQPRLIDQYTLGRFSTSEAEADHHAFGWFAVHDVLAMPLAEAHWERVDADGDGYAELRQAVYEHELLLFRIDADATRQSGDGIQLLGELTHDSPVRRSAFIEDVLYSIATGSIQAVSIVDPTVMFATVDLPDPIVSSSGPIPSDDQGEAAVLSRLSDPPSFEPVEIRGRTFEDVNGDGLDLGLPQDFLRVGSFDTTYWVEDVELVGNLAYVCDRNLQILDVSDPETPVVVGEFETPGSANGVQVVGNLAYVADGGEGLHILDVSDPAAPFLVGSFDTPDPDYDPAAPVLVGSFETPGYAYSVQVVGNIAYVANGATGLQILDVSDPAAPSLLGNFNRGGQAFDVHVVGDLAYVADGSYLRIVDVSDPATPTAVGKIDPPKPAGAARLVGNSSEQPPGPSTPVRASLRLDAGWVVAARVEGNLVYVADTEHGLQIVDVSDPSAPTFVGNIDTPDYARSLQVVGSRVYVADGSSLQIVDVSQPAAPTLVGSFDMPEGASNVQVVGNLAFVGGRDGLQIIDLSEPGMGGVLIQLYRDGGDGIFGSDGAGTGAGTGSDGEDDVFVDSKFTSDGTGSYSFSVDEPGTYFVLEQRPEGYAPTAPAHSFHTVAITPDDIGSDVSGIDFGNHRPSDWVGVHRGRKFFMDLNGNGHWDGIAGGDMVYKFGTVGDVPVIGDFNGDGYDEIGVYRPGSSKFFLDRNGNGRWDGVAGGDVVYRFGVPGIDTPIIGDWNGDGVDDIGVHRKRNFFLDANGNGRWDKASGGDLLHRMGKIGDVAVIGDWNGDGRDDIGLRRNAKFFLDANGNGRWNGPGEGQDVIHVYRETGETAVAGDWNDDGKDEIGTHSVRLFYLDANDNGNWDRRGGGDMVYAFGSPTDTPIIGKWGRRPAPLMAASTPGARVAGQAASDEAITQEALAPIVEYAIDVWSARPLSVQQEGFLKQLDVRIADLPGATLGQVLGTTIWLDANAAGHGWFVDATPGDDVEFGPPDESHESAGLPSSFAADRADLLTVALHELGHVLGYDHSDDGVMEDLLPPGTRRLWDDEYLDRPTRLDAAIVGPGFAAKAADEYFAMT